MIGKFWLGLFAFYISMNAYADSLDQACTQRQCTKGEIVTIKGNGPKDYYFACPTKALSNYTNGVSGLLEMQYSLTGRLPKFNRKTGDPIYEGESADTVARLHEDANVPTFLDAMDASEACFAGSVTSEFLS